MVVNETAAMSNRNSWQNNKTLQHSAVILQTVPNNKCEVEKKQHIYRHLDAHNIQYITFINSLKIILTLVDIKLMFQHLRE